MRIKLKNKINSTITCRANVEKYSPLSDTFCLTDLKLINQQSRKFSDHCWVTIKNFFEIKKLKKFLNINYSDFISNKKNGYLNLNNEIQIIFDSNISEYQKGYYKNVTDYELINIRIKSIIINNKLFNL